MATSIHASHQCLPMVNTTVCKERIACIEQKTTRTGKFRLEGRRSNPLLPLSLGLNRDATLITRSSGEQNAGEETPSSLTRVVFGAVACHAAATYFGFLLAQTDIALVT